MIYFRLVLIRDIFRTDIPPDILIDCVVTCLQSLKVPNNEILVIEILSTLSECNRFKLAIEFTSLEDKSICHELFEALRRSENIENKTVVDTLARKYIYWKNDDTTKWVVNFPFFLPPIINSFDCRCELFVQFIRATFFFNQTRK